MREYAARLKVQERQHDDVKPTTKSLRPGTITFPTGLAAKEKRDEKRADAPAPPLKVIYYKLDALPDLESYGCNHGWANCLCK